MQQEAAQQGRFFGRDDVKRETINGYQLGWHTRPENTGAAHLVGGRGASCPLPTSVAAPATSSPSVCATVLGVGKLSCQWSSLVCNDLDHANSAFPV